MHYNAMFTRIKEGNTGGLFLFHGAEEFVKQSALTQLKESVDLAVRDLNVLECRAPSAANVLEVAETLPFFAERRLVVCYEMADAEVKALVQQADDMPETTTVVVYVRGACKKDILKELEKSGRAVEFGALSEVDAMRFVEKRARIMQVRLAPNASRLIVEMVGTEAHALINEFTKAAQYAGEGNEVNEGVLRACITPNLEYEFFGMFDHLLAGRKKQAMLALRHMLREDSGSAFPLAHAFERQCKQMLAVRMALNAGVKEKDIAAKLKLTPWAARTALRGAKRYSVKRLRAATLHFAEVDYLQVSGRMTAERALEIAVLRHF